MSSSSVLVILSNYNRPSYLPACIAAWRGQSLPPACIIVVDNSPRPVDEELPERYPNPLFEGVDDVWRFRRNLGCPARFAPLLAMAHQYEYAILADDDLLPGLRAIEVAMEAATLLSNEFTTIGQIGRMVNQHNPRGNRYVCGNAPRKDGVLSPVDLTCRCYMVKTSRLRGLVAFRQMLAGKCRSDGGNGLPLLDIHDDMQLCFGIQLYSGCPSYVISLVQDPQRQLILRNLPEGNGGVWRRPSHFQERNQMVDMALEAGWLPIRR